jgi:hypothetical protein
MRKDVIDSDGVLNMTRRMVVMVAMQRARARDRERERDVAVKVACPQITGRIKKSKERRRCQQQLTC